MLFGSINRSRNQIDEQSAKRSSSVTLKVVRARRSASTCGGLGCEVDAPGRAGARRVEEVAVARKLSGSGQPGAGATVEFATGIVAEEGRFVATTRKAPLLQPEQEDDLEASRTRPQQV